MPKFLGKEKLPKQLKSFVAVFIPEDISPWEKITFILVVKNTPKNSQTLKPPIHTSVKSSPKYKKTKCLDKEIPPKHIKSIFTETAHNLVSEKYKKLLYKKY